MQRHYYRRAWGGPSPAARLHGPRRGAVRALSSRHDPRRYRAWRETDAGREQGRVDGESVSLHRIRSDLSGHSVSGRPRAMRTATNALELRRPKSLMDALRILAKDPSLT